MTATQPRPDVDAPAIADPAAEDSATVTPPPATGAFGYPVFLELRERTVLVAGGGAEAAGKILGLLGVGARVVAWAPRHDQTAAFDGDERVELLAGPFEASLL